MAGVNQLYSMSNPVFVSFVFYATLVILKMFAVTFLTIYRRITKQVFANVEDIRLGDKKDNKPVLNNESVERVRRNHLNDLENIPAFLILGLLYIAIQPSPGVALWHFRIFVFSRIAHTFIYQLFIPQPARGLAFTIGLGVCISMAIQLLMAAC